MYPPELYPCLTIQSRSAARRAAQDLVVANYQIPNQKVIIETKMEAQCKEVDQVGL